MNNKVLEKVDLTEAALLNKLRSGDHAAFDEFYAKYWKPLYRLSFKILKNEQESEDIVQETFIRFWEHREKISATNIKGWLFTISYRLVLKSLQKNKQTDKIDAVLENEPLAEPTDQSLHMRQFQLQLSACVNELPDQCRTVYKLSREEHRSVKHISQKLGISPKTVEAHITTALKRIKRGLGYATLLLIFLH